VKRILLLRPPVVEMRTSYAGVRITPPLTLAYLAAALREAGHQPLVLDALLEGHDRIGDGYAKNSVVRGLPVERILERIAELGPIDALAISTMFSQDWPETAKLIRELHRHHPVPVIVGGEHASAAAEYILRTTPEVTLAAHGEGEETLVDFANWLAGRTKLEEITGVTRRGAAGDAIRNPSRPRIRSVDTIAEPAWDLFDMDGYFTHGHTFGVERGRTIPMLATRGCPYRCTFCSSPQMWTTKYVTRDPELVLDEIERYIATYGVRNIEFHDLTAITKRSWILKFTAGIERRGLDFTWQLPSGTRSEALDEEVIAAISRTGCVNLAYAPESGSERTLKAIKKKVDLDKLTNSVRIAVEHRMTVKCNLIIGFPHETHRDIWQTIRYAARLGLIGVEDTGIYLFSPYPGSELYEELRADGTLPEMSDEYFATLLQYTDITKGSVYCRNVGARTLLLYRIVGMLGFYSLAYLRRPGRILRTARNLRHREASSLLESRLGDRIKTLRRDQRTAKRETNSTGQAGSEKAAPREETAGTSTGVHIRRRVPRSTEERCLLGGKGHETTPASIPTQQS
jgi:anaerobic magnesium-protoporphyrin IX monomethyl ester cyclase